LQLGCDASVEALAFAGQDVGVASFFHAGSLWLWEDEGKYEGKCKANC
jgi:hypothetical protein